jgi:hypothetical protein
MSTPMQASVTGRLTLTADKGTAFTVLAAMSSVSPICTAPGFSVVASLMAFRRGHERGTLLMPHEYQLDTAVFQRSDKVFVLLTRHAKDALDTFHLQTLDKQLRRIHE